MAILLFVVGLLFLIAGLLLLVVGARWLIDSAVAFACLPIFFTGGKISRGEGIVLFVYYIAYTLYLVLATTHHDALAGFSTMMLYYVIPLTVLTLGIIAVREIRGRKRSN